MNHLNLKRASEGIVINTDKEALLRRRKEIKDSNTIKALLERVDDLEKRVRELENVKT